MNLPDPVKSVCLLLLMKVSSNVIEYQFEYFNNRRYASVNGTCRLRRASQHLVLANSSNTGLMLMYSIGFLLPVLGGWISGAWLGHVRALRLGGAIMLPPAMLLELMLHYRLVCRDWMYFTLWVPVPFFVCLVLPNLFYAFLLLQRGPKSRTVLVLMYYCAAATGEALGMAPDMIEWRFGVRIPAGVLLGVAYAAASLLLPEDQAWEREAVAAAFEFPTRRRLIRYTKILAAPALFIAVQADGWKASNPRELLHYLNGTISGSPDRMLYSELPHLCFALGTIAASLCLLGVSLCRLRPLSMGLRIRAGILLEIAVTSAMTLANLWPERMSTLGCEQPQALVGAYLAASLLDGAANALALAACYELVDQISPPSSKSLVVGVLFTVWGVGVNAGSLASLATQRMAPPAQFYGHRLISLGLLLFLLFYAGAVALPLAEGLTALGVETEPLLLQAKGQVHQQQQEHQQEQLVPLPVRPDSISRHRIGSTYW